MAKRILALLLMLAMLVTGLSLSVSAAPGKETVDGVSYVTVTNEQDLFDALQKGGNILLKNDIVLSTKFQSAVKVFPGTVLNGAGYTLTYKSPRSANLFNFAMATVVGNGEIVIKNLNFGTKDQPFVLNGTKTLFANVSANTNSLQFQNVNFYVEKTTGVDNNSAALFMLANSVMSFEGCMLYVRLSGATAGSLHGGWFTSVDSQVTMTNCVTTGSVVGRYGAGAFAAQVSTGELWLKNCVNLANVAGSGYVGGFVGNSGTGAQRLYFSDCVNYGNITSTGTSYESMAGGMIGRMSNRMDQDSRRLNVLYDCVNYGTIKSGSSAGGFVGRSHDHDYQSQLYYTFGNCVNFGNVSGDIYAGGIMGVASPRIYRAEFIDCLNIGKITSSKGAAGNFAGLLSNGRVTGGYAVGVVSAVTKAKAGAIAGETSGSYMIQAGSNAGTTMAIKAPTYTDVTYYGSIATIPTGVTKIADSGLDALLDELSAVYGKEFIKADSSNANATVVLAAPALRGVQLDTTKMENGKISMRFVAALDASEAYSAYGFDLSITTSAGTITEKVTSSQLLTKIVKTVGGKSSNLSASTISVEYFFTTDALNLPADERVVIKATPYAISKDASKTYTGTTKLITLEDGMVVNEYLLLNGTMLENFAIVWEATAHKMSEKLLAQRLSDKIAELTGIVIPVFPDYNKHTYAAEIVIGKSAKKGTNTAPAGRNIFPIGDTASIAITGDNTAQLSEAVTYFLEQVEALVKIGENQLTIDEKIVVPADTQVSIMAFNMGAKDNARIKEHEWNLIVDYLPDIMTFQEPWAGFLDDFLNNYAVQPTSPFKASTSDDDVMVTDVNNKAFTGKGYYGVYWGEPRWKPSDPNTPADGYSKHAGKASYSVILYAKDRFTVDEENSGTFWLSDRPYVSNSMFLGSSFARCATYATLIDNNTGEKFVVVNVHLDFDEKIKTPSVQVLLTELKKLVPADLPIFVTGDMNSEAGSGTINYYMSNPIMSMTSLDDISARAYRDERNIDWLFTNKPEELDVTYYQYCGEWNFMNDLWDSQKGQMIMGKPSDHPAVYAEFTFK